MTTLHDRLAELADDAPPGGPAPDLWDRGRRYRRVRLAGTAVIVGVASVVVALVVGVSWQRSVPPAPQPAGTPAGLPDHVWAPSKWLPGTDDEGPLGQLAVVVPAERGSWTGTSPGVAGVSATTGEYRFLDLPDLSADGWALSPDGLHVAYWTAGDASGEPNGEDPSTGFAVYDTTTGDIERVDVPTEHGLSGDTLVWADDTRLLLEYGQWAEGGASGGSGTDNWLRSWALGDDEPVRVDANFASVAGDGRFLASADLANWYELVDLDAPGEVVPIRVEGRAKLASIPVVDPAGSQVAGIWGGPKPGSSRIPNKVKVGPVPPGGGVADLGLVPDSGRTLEVERWTGDGEVVVTRAQGRYLDELSLERLDVATGSTVTLSTYSSPQPMFAADLLTAPTFDAQEPPDPADPRWVAGLLAGTVLAAAGLLGLWRRRVRP